MFTPLPRSRRFPLFRRLWKPAVIMSAAGTVIAVRFDEILERGQEILALLFLIAMAGPIYLLDIFIFRSCKPRREDMKSINDKGANK
ncbi:MAG TPA: hypothetical protein VK249_24335 [Anaerolineales bacterium]|nr:hypothetical protein [Anaerolineales bacterium]